MSSDNMSGNNCHADCNLYLRPAPEGILGAAALPSSGTWLSNGTASVEPDGRILAANDVLAAWAGLSPDELRGASLPDLLGRRHPEWNVQLRGFLGGKLPFDRMELSDGVGHALERLSVEMFRHDASCLVSLNSIAPMARELEALFPEESWGRFMANPMGQRLLRAEAQVENLMNRWPGIIFSQRPDFSLLFVSPRIEELTGVAPSEWRRQSRYFWDMVHEADADALAARMRIEAHNPAGVTSTFRIRHIHTGRVSYLWEHRTAVRSGNGLLMGFEGIWLDITRQTIAERRLLNLSWSENLGALSMGLTHDFCNMMTGIVGLSDVFQATVGPGEVREGLGMIRKTAFQASQLAHRIRRLHQGTPGEKNFHDLNEVVGTLAQVLDKVLPSRVRVKTALDPNQLPLYTDAVELQQVIVNLALNAADAMPEGGHLTFKTARHEEFPPIKVLQGTLPRLPAIHLSVQDTGTGIPFQSLTSIFDPFFTTKPLGRGSGLGLYNARLFAEKHGAAISVDTGEGTGTTFHLWFAQADFTETEAAQRPEQRPVRHTLLVAGTAGQALDPTIQMLRRHGYYVVSANNAAEAVEALHSPHFQFSGVLLLCTAPHPEDLALCRRIRSQKLPLRILLGVFGCNQDELDAVLLKTVDGVLPMDLAAGDCMSRLKTLVENR